MKIGVFNKFPQRHLKKKLLKKKVFLPTNPEKFGDITGNTTFFFLRFSETLLKIPNAVYCKMNLDKSAICQNWPTASTFGSENQPKPA